MATEWMEYDEVVTDYPVLRAGFEEADVLDDDEVDAWVAARFFDAEADEVEDFLKGLQGLGKTLAPYAKKAVPGMIKGASQGAMIGGPWGAVAGAIGGGASSLLGRGQPGAPAVGGGAAGGGPSGVGPSMGGVAALASGSVPSAGPEVRNAAAVVLVWLLSRPETGVALLRLMNPQLAAAPVKVGGRSVSPGALVGALAGLAKEAAEASPVARPGGAEHVRPQVLLAELAEVVDAQPGGAFARVPDEDDTWLAEELEAHHTAEGIRAYEDALAGWVGA